jgi:excisionase family DNA binding protein
LSERTVGTAEAAKYIGVSKKTILKYCRKRQITFMIYPGGEYRFRQSALDIWMASRTYQATTKPPVLKKAA